MIKNGSCVIPTYHHWPTMNLLGKLLSMSDHFGLGDLNVILGSGGCCWIKTTQQVQKGQYLGAQMCIELYKTQSLSPRSSKIIRKKLFIIATVDLTQPWEEIQVKVSSVAEDLSPAGVTLFCTPWRKAHHTAIPHIMKKLMITGKNTNEARHIVVADAVI